MSFRIKDRSLDARLQRDLRESRREHADSLEKLSSGEVFTRQDPRPADRALAENMDFRLRSLSASRRNINDSVSLLQTAESSLAEINNLILRMKEINISAANTTMSPQERRYLFIEYEALHDEINRIAVTTQFNSIPLLNGEDERSPEELVFRIDDPFPGEQFTDDEDINAIRFTGLQSIVATTEGLGLSSAIDLLEDSSAEEGLELYDVEEMLEPWDDEVFPTVYDEALATLSEQRAVLGAMQSRLMRSLDFMDVYQENIAAARSNIADVDYAQEVSRQVENQIAMQASSSLLTQGNVVPQIALNLLRGAM